jgi:phosphoglycolate phosphatase-like HAD superfamily hydrolase
MMDTSSNKEKIIFDLDGTILNVYDRDYYVYADIIREFERKVLPRLEYDWYRKIQVPIAEILIASDAHDIITEFLEERSKRIENSSYLCLDTLIVGAKEILEAVYGQYELHLVTARFDKNATNDQLWSLGIRELFHDVVLTSGQSKRPIFESLNNVVCVVGDTENDIVPAKALGIKAIAVMSGIRSRKNLQALYPDFLLNDIRELMSVLLIDEGNSTH